MVNRMWDQTHKGQSSHAPLHLSSSATSAHKSESRSSTIEMVDMKRVVDVAVIDEVQMIASPDRGWAWTRALLGMPATEVRVCICMCVRVCLSLSLSQR